MIKKYACLLTALILFSGLFSCKNLDNAPSDQAYGLEPFEVMEDAFDGKTFQEFR